jgi:hypothetical protein
MSGLFTDPFGSTMEPAGVAAGFPEEMQMNAATTTTAETMIPLIIAFFIAAPFPIVSIYSELVLVTTRLFEQAPILNL